MGGYGPYRLSVQFDPDTGSPASLISHRAGEEGVFAQRWRGTDRLPAPEETVRQLSKRRAASARLTRQPFLQHRSKRPSYNIDNIGGVSEKVRRRLRFE